MSCSGIFVDLTACLYALANATPLVAVVGSSLLDIIFAPGNRHVHSDRTAASACYNGSAGSSFLVCDKNPQGFDVSIIPRRSSTTSLRSTTQLRATARFLVAAA